jgi:hypothetical protein
VLAFFIESNTRKVYIVILKVDSSALNYIKKINILFFTLELEKKITKAVD